MRSFAPLTVLLALALGACGDSTGPKETYFGSYELQSIGGDLLPFTTFEDPDLKSEIVAETLFLKPEGTYTGLRTIRVTDEDGPWTTYRIDQGTFTIRRSNLTITDEWGRSHTGKLRGNKLTITGDEDVSWVYLKE